MRLFEITTIIGGIIGFPFIIQSYQNGISSIGEAFVVGFFLPLGFTVMGALIGLFLDKVVSYHLEKVVP